MRAALLFAFKLKECRSKGLADYGRVAARYVNEFEKKWVGTTDTADGSELLGTADIQSLADLANSVSIVRNVRIVPVSQRMLVALGVPALLPFLPLILFIYPIESLAEQIVKALFAQ